jgi:hypothetical protein
MLGIGIGLTSQRGVSLNALIARLFANDEPGALFDASDLTSMFQGRTGTTAAAVGSPVGYALDKREMGGKSAAAFIAGQPELVVNGGFDSDFSGWTAGAFGGSPAVLSVNSGRLRVTNDTAGGNGYVTQSFETVVGRSYQVTWAVYIGTATLPRISVGTSAGANQIYNRDVNTSGTYSAIILATTTTSYVNVLNNTTTADLFTEADNISVKEVPGNHAVAPSDAARPILGRVPASGRRNLLTRTEEFDNGAWTKNNVTVTANAAIAPDGTMTADQLTATADLGNVLQANVQSADVTHTQSLYVKSATGSPVSGAIFGISSAATRTDFVATNDWQRIENTVASLGGTRFPQVRLDNSGDSIFIWGAQLELGSTATPYQRVTTAFDVTEAGVRDCYYLRDDGVDDALNATLPDLGTDATLAYASNTGVTILTGQTIGAGAFDILRDQDLFGLLAINRALTAPETANVTKWLEQRGPD